MNRATTVEEIEPLAQLCRHGKLFEVQEWVAAGRPVALPEGTRGRAKNKNPLQIAMEAGFHSLVKVLLEAGAPVREGNYDAMVHAITMRRVDLVTLFVSAGVDPEGVSMRHVVESWDGEIVDLFLSHGASLVRDRPIAWGLIYKIRPVLGLLKRFAPEQPELLEQANLALRYHASEGNAKWVALSLWAGADPWAKGAYRFEDEDDPSDDNALEHLVSGGHVDLLKQKALRTALCEKPPGSIRLLENACSSRDGAVLELLFDLGYDPHELPDLGTGAIRRLVSWMSFESSYRDRWGLSATDGIDSSRARERMRMLHLLVANGAKWIPADKTNIRDFRQCLLKMKRDYVLEFIWLMQNYRAARRHDVKELLRSGAMTKLLGEDQAEATRLLNGVPEEVEIGQIPGGDLRR